MRSWFLVSAFVLAGRSLLAAEVVSPLDLGIDYQSTTAALGSAFGYMIAACVGLLIAVTMCKAFLIWVRSALGVPEPPPAAVAAPVEVNEDKDKKGSGCSCGCCGGGKGKGGGKGYGRKWNYRRRNRWRKRW